MMPELRIHA